MIWKDILEKEFAKEYFQQISGFLTEEYAKYTIYPAKNDIFNAFEYSPYEKIKVVILGMDPYIGPNQAHGLSFSVKPGNRIPPSLKNIYKELKEDLGIVTPSHGYLKHWSTQGVLLLNAALTVREGQTASHMKIWEPFTNNIIRELNNHENYIVFLLWGNFARKKKVLITNDRHLVLEYGHPSPLSCNLFFGNKHFSTCNKYLIDNNLKPIDWSIPELC